MPWYVNSLFAQAQAAAQTPDQPTSIPWYVNLLVAVGTLAISFFLGGYLGKKLRMVDHGWKIGLSLFTLLASVAVLLLGPSIKYGVDLSGGAILVYEVDQSKKTAGETLGSAEMEKLIAAISRRVNPGGQKEVVVRPYGKEQVEIIVPEKDDAEVKRIEWIISQAGNLEFRILANKKDNKDIIDRAEADPSKNRIYDSAGKLLARWVPVRVEEAPSIAHYTDVGLRHRKKGDREILEALILADDYNITGAYLTRADTGVDRSGRPCVNFTFNAAGGQLFGEMTSNHLPDKGLTEFTYKLGIVLDDELYSAPSIQSTITDRGEITGTFTQEQVQSLVNVLNAGSLPAALTKEPISKLFSGPTLGRDTIEKSTRAMLISAILVPLFMLWYYRFSGIVANIALILNMLMLFAIMIAFKAPFTLTGFAGMALTVGMAVDNNVLVYERLREELERGATLRMAIRNAFSRASATIIDANLTTLIAATVMYVIGTDQIKGFAVPLWLGVAISMFTSVFVARVIFDVAEKRGWITTVKMQRIIGHTNIDFMAMFPYTLTASILITVMAIGVSIYRGQGLFDIDFTGGVSVQAVFNEPQDTNDVRKILSEQPEEERLPDLAITDVQVADEAKGLQFIITTSEPSLKNVERELSKVFKDKLARNSMKFDAPAAIPAAPDTKNDAKNAVKKSAEAEKKPAGAELVDVPGAKPGAKKPLSAEADKAKTAEAAVPAKAAPYAGGTASQLTFARPVNHETAVQLVTAAMAKVKMPESTQFALSNDKYTEDDRASYPTWTLKMLAPPEKVKSMLDTAGADLAASPIFPASSEIGGAVAGNTRLLAVYALVVSWICMIIYLWIRFQGAAFGIAAVVALVHDVLVMLGAIAVSIYLAPFLGILLIEPFKLNLTIVAAFLTIIGYSVNDTIVIFDRIREVRGKDPDVTRKMVNDSTNQTMSRTLLTSFTVLLVVVVLYLFGGEAVHGFAFVLLIGVATGTYSSIYIASPILLWLAGKRHHVAALIERK